MSPRLRRWETNPAGAIAPPPFRPPPPDLELAALLDRYAPFQPVALCPSISTYHARSLVRIWEVAEELAGAELPAPFWAYPWAAGAALARAILDEPERVRGRRVIDFGTGGGIVAIAAAKAGAADIVANDVDPWALAVARLAARRQGFFVRLLCADLTAMAEEATACDVLLCSDLGYERSVAPAQRRLLERARTAGVDVIVADAGRTYFDATGLRTIAEHTLRVPLDLEGVATRTARVYTMPKPRPRRRQD